jgi:hypothetical protein
LHYGAGKGITQAGKNGRRNYQIRETRLVKKIIIISTTKNNKDYECF